MYHNTSDPKIYSSLLRQNEEKPRVASLVERCPKSFIPPGFKNTVHSDGPRMKIQTQNYLWKPGDELHGPVEVALASESAVVDCRPKVFDGVSNTWRLMDTGSMCSVVKKTDQDVIDKSRVLQAVNGTSIESYGQKEIHVRIGRKTYSISSELA